MGILYRIRDVYVVYMYFYLRFTPVIYTLGKRGALVFSLLLLEFPVYSL